MREYLERQSEQAFAELVARHVNLVYSTALRVVHEPQMAQDVAQATFILLARKAKSVRDPDALGGWLYRTASNTAANALRADQRRHQREAEAVNRAKLDSDPHGTWEAIRPLLEPAMRQLKPAEQDALVLRYFQGKSLREAGQTLAITEDAVQKRVSRALDKLRTHFARKGVVISAAVLATVLSSHTVQAVPPGLAAALASSSLAGAGSAAASTPASILKFLVMTKVQAATLGLLFLAGVATPLTLGPSIHWRRPGASASDNLPAVVTEAGLNTTGPSAATPATAPADSPALARLRDWLTRAQHSALVASHDEDIRRVTRGLAPSDFPRAWALYCGLKPSRLRGKFGPILMAAWGAKDGPAAVAAALAVTDSSRRNSFLDSAACAWARNHPADAAAWIKYYYPETEQALKLRLVFYGCGPDNPQAARVLWQQLPPGILRDTAAESFVGALAEQDAPAAAACLNDIGSSAIRRNARADLLSAWARKDPTAAFAWAQSQPRLHDRDDAIHNVAYTLSQQNPAQAAEMLTTLSSLAVEDDRGGISGVIERWAADDLTAATAWAKQLSQGPLRDRALESLATSWVEQDPQGAVAFVQTLPEGASRSKLLSQATCAWACQDAKAAFSWLQALPDGPARNSALIGFSDGLAVQKPEQAARFVAALPAGDLQTEAALKVVNRWVEDNPSSAAAWAAALPAGPTREQAVTAAARQWLQGDRVAAEAWLQKTDLPAEAKAKLLHK